MKNIPNPNIRKRKQNKKQQVERLTPTRLNFLNYNHPNCNYKNPYLNSEWDTEQIKEKLLTWSKNEELIKLRIPNGQIGGFLAYSDLFGILKKKFIYSFQFNLLEQYKYKKLTEKEEKEQLKIIPSYDIELYEESIQNLEFQIEPNMEILFTITDVQGIFYYGKNVIKAQKSNGTSFDREIMLKSSFKVVSRLL